ncbi:MAG: type 4a pilus biogenesis protein PilO [Nitrospirota bacterium]|jgi:Tfp pilus assembly protein PilO
MENILPQQLLNLDLSKLSWREKIIIIVTIIAAFYFFFYQALYLSKAKEANSLRSEIITINNELTSFTAQITEMAKRIDELKKAAPANELTEIRRLTGDATKLSFLLEEFTRLARGTKVDFIAIKPTMVEDKGRYMELKLSIDLRAKYQQLGEYVKALEDLPRGMVINDIRIELNLASHPLSMARIDAVTFIPKE